MKTIDEIIEDATEKTSVHFLHEDQIALIKTVAYKYNTQQCKKCKIKNNRKLYSVNDIHKVLDYISKNYSKIEDELAEPHENKKKELPKNFYKNAKNVCIKRAIESVK